IGKAKEQVPQLMAAHADLAIFRHSEVAEDLGSVHRRGTSVEDPLMRPNIPWVASYFSARPGVNDDEGIDESIPVIVEWRKVYHRIGGGDGVARHGARVGQHVAQASSAMRVCRQRLRHRK